MNFSKESVTLNPEPKILTREITIEGLKVDPCTNGFFAKESSFSLRPSLYPGIRFVIGDTIIPYDEKHLSATDSVFGRMLKLSDKAETVQILIVEHLLSALQLVGLSSHTDIHLGTSCYAKLLSGKAAGIGFQKPTYIIPICGAGVSGYIEQILPYCTPTGEEKSSFSVEKRQVFSLQESLEGKYRGIIREIIMEPSERFEIEILSAQQPDIKNNPDAQSFSISEGKNLYPFLKARPIMRLTNHFEAAAIWVLSLRSFALTPETYFKSRPGLSKESVTGRMHEIFRENGNEHLAHTAIADFPSELGAFTGGKIIKGKFILRDTNHVFRLLALRHLLKIPT